MMKTPASHSDRPDRVDRLYRLLPTIHRQRDAEQGYPLKALLRVISEQVNVVEDDIAQLYENLFIETAEDWAVPYIGDLVGYRPASPSGTVDHSAHDCDAGCADDCAGKPRSPTHRLLVPRREVANTPRYRRRKGSLKLLELLANDVSGWPARAVEFYRLLGWNQNINHLHLDRGRAVDVRGMEELGALDGPFDVLAHSVDVRRINSGRTAGRYGLRSVGLFLWRLKSYSVTRSPACCFEKAGPHAFTFSFLGQDAPLFTKPETAAGETLIDRQVSVPAPIGRLEFSRHIDRFYGPGKSLEIWAEGWSGADGKQSIPATAVVAADLSDWNYTVPPNQVAVDPVLGRFAFPSRQLPKRVRVAYHYGMSDDIGGGEYRRPLFEPAARPGPDGVEVAPSRYVVGRAGQTYARIGDALAAWAQEQPLDAVIEVADSDVYVESLAIHLGAGQTLQLRAANRARPALRLLDYNTDAPDPLVVTLAQGSRFVLDGFMVLGRPLRLEGAGYKPNDTPEVPPDSAPVCNAEVVIRHCTLVPGWTIDCHCDPSRPEEPSLELFNVRAALRIERSIVGSIEINEDEVQVAPIPVRISDSILDSTGSTIEAVGAPGCAVAHAVLTVLRSTVFGIVNVHAIEMAENSIFMDCLNVARRQLGCMRFCYVPPRCRTPRRHHCQPDLVVQAVRETADAIDQPAVIAAETARVRPQFTAERYGRPGYAQLAGSCAEEIRRGADDESEMGVFHDLFQPQRASNLQTRLDEYTPSGFDAGLVFVT